MKDQLKAGIILSYLSTAVSILIQLVYMPVMIRLLGQSEYGLNSLVSGVVSYLSLFSLGFSGAYLRFFARFRQKNDRDGMASLNGMFFSLFCVLAAAALICGITLSFFPEQIFGSKLSGGELQEARILMIILVINMAISLAGSVFDCMITAYEQFIFQRIISLCAAVINPFVCLPLLLMGYGNIMLVVVSLCFTVARLALNIWFCFRKLNIPISFRGFRFSLLKEVGVFSFFLLLNMVIDQINWNVDKLILSHTDGTNEVAVYGVASQINSLVMTFSTTISAVFSPRINRIAADDSLDVHKEFTALMAKVGRIQWMVLGLVTMGFVVFGKYFIVSIYAGSEYEDAYLTALFLVIPALVPWIQNTGIEVQRAINRHQFRSIVYFIMAMINVFISIPLAARFGSVGAAMGTAISLVLANGIIMNVFYHKALRIDMFFFWKEIAKTLPGFLIPAVLGALIMRYISFDHLIQYAGWILLFTVVYCLSIYCLSCNAWERALVLGLFRGKRMNNKSECCGCGACQQICPVQCITMRPDEEGFFYPEIDESQCIHCGKCESVCPIRYPLVPTGDTETYVGFSNDQKIRKASSSGGVFSLAAEWVLKQNGVVFGAAFDERFAVHHIGIEAEEELCKLRGSKYVQSDLKNTYAEAKKHLTDGRWVLFSGTACQIAGLKKYLGYEYHNLLTVDVLCHGVPSPKIWELYLENQEQKYNSKVISIQFRDKRLGWKGYSVTIQFENGKEYSVPFTKDPFMNMFLGNIDLRPSCHDCRFKEFPRVSDFTIGDCWGIESHMPEMDDDQGTSVILVHSEKGQKRLGEIRENMQVKKAEMDKVLPISADSRKSVAVHPNRKKFWKAEQKGEQIEQLARYTRKNFFQKVVSFIKYMAEKGE